MSFPYLIQGSNIVVVIDNTPHTINKSHITYDKLKEAIKAADWEAVRELVNPKEVVLKYAEGFVKINGDQFTWMGKPMHNALSRKMIEMLKDGFPVTPLVRFMERLMDNPSKRAVDELYGFLEKGNLPITPDGYFLAYKKVRDDYTDCHTGTMDNSVGKIVSMPRNEVDDDKDRTCSAGLHFCSQEYLSHFGGARTVILKINPKDVVSIPSDYNDSKGRACRYEVIGELTVDPGKAFVKPVQETAVGSQPVAPKEGTGPFSLGYQTGYQGSKGLMPFGYTEKQRIAYLDGFNRGSADRSSGLNPAYVYVGQPQKGGRALSMTKDAIRKREARARAKAEKERTSMPRPQSNNTPGNWPHPKGFKR